MRAASWKALRIPESTRAWRSWHAPIMPDSTTVATVFPPAASAASRTFSCLFSPTRFHEDPEIILASSASLPRLSRRKDSFGGVDSVRAVSCLLAQGRRGVVRRPRRPWKPSCANRGGYGMNARSSGRGGTIGTSKNGGAGGPNVVALGGEHTAVCSGAAKAEPAATGPVMGGKGGAGVVGGRRVAAE